MYLYEKSFGSHAFNFGYAAAIAWCLFLLIALIAIVNSLLVRRISRRRLAMVAPPSRSTSASPFETPRARAASTPPARSPTSS